MLVDDGAVVVVGTAVGVVAAGWQGRLTGAGRVTVTGDRDAAVGAQEEGATVESSAETGNDGEMDIVGAPGNAVRTGVAAEDIRGSGDAVGGGVTIAGHDTAGGSALNQTRGGLGVDSQRVRGSVGVVDLLDVVVKVTVEGVSVLANEILRCDDADEVAAGVGHALVAPGLAVGGGLGLESGADVLHRGRGQTQGLLGAGAIGSAELDAQRKTDEVDGGDVGEDTAVGGPVEFHESPVDIRAGITGVGYRRFDEPRAGAGGDDEEVERSLGEVDTRGSEVARDGGGSGATLSTERDGDVSVVDLNRGAGAGGGVVEGSIGVQEGQLVGAIKTRDVGVDVGVS